MKTNANLLGFLLLLLSCFLVVSCSKDDDDDIRDGNEASYDISIIKTSGDTVRLIGNGNVGIWDPSLLFVNLTADEVNLPTGSFLMNITQPAQSKAVIESAFLSTSDQLTGTAEEINAKAYSLQDNTEGELINVIVGGNYISAKIDEMPMEETTTGEEVTVTGTFVAISN